MQFKRKIAKSLIPICNIMGVNIAAINMEWLLSYINENIKKLKEITFVYLMFILR